MAGVLIEACIYDLGEHRVKRFFVRVKLPNGKDVTGTFRTIREARAFRDAKRAKRAQGALVDARSETITFEQYAEEWRASRAKLQAPSTVAKIARDLKVHVYPVIGSKKIASIRKTQVQALVGTMAETLAPVSVRNVYSLSVAGVFKAAVDDDVIVKSPCVGIRMPRAKKRDKIVPLTTDEVRHVAENITEGLQVAVLLAAATGLRPGELFGLTVDRVDFLKRTVTIDRQLRETLVDGTKEMYYLGPVKTEASEATIAVDEETLNRLSLHLQRFPAQRLTMLEGRPSDPGMPERRKRVEVDLLFSFNGGVVDRSRQSTEFRRAAEGLELPPRTSWHALRHYCASALIAGGANVKAVQHQMRHDLLSMTLDRYTHLMEEDDEKTRAILAASARALLGAA